MVGVERVLKIGECSGLEVIDLRTLLRMMPSDCKKSI